MAPAQAQLDEGDLPQLDEVSSSIEKRLFVGHIADETTLEELFDVFGEFGPVTEVRMLPAESAAFVGMESWAAAHRALTELDGIRQLADHSGDQTLHVRFDQRNWEKKSAAAFARGLENTPLAVGGIPEKTSSDVLEELFSEYGDIREITLAAPHEGVRSGVVSFSLWGEALDALEALNGRPHPDGSSRELTVSFAEEPLGAQPEKRVQLTAAVKRPPDRPRERPEDSGGARLEKTNADPATFTRLREDYLVALVDGSPRERCDELHEKLMATRPCWPRRKSDEKWTANKQPVRPPRKDASPLSRRSARPSPQPHPRRSSRRSPATRRSEKPLDVPPPPRNGDNRSGNDVKGGHKVYVTGLPLDCSNEELAHLINQLPLRSAPRGGRVLVETDVLAFRGAGYITFKTREAARDALEELDDREVKGWDSTLSARWVTWPGREPEPATEPQGRRSGRSRSRRRSPMKAASEDQVDKCRLFVGQLQVMENGVSRLRALFGPFGPIEECRYIESKGVAFIGFRSERDARAALKQMDGATIAGVSRNDGLSVKYASKR